MSHTSKVRFWSVSIVGWSAICVVIAMFPILQLPAMLLLLGTLISKAFSLLDGIFWIWDCGLASTTRLHNEEIEFHTKTEQDRRKRLFEEFAAAPRQISLFGIFDWQWLQQIESWSGGTGLRRTGSTCLTWLRTFLYRFEALMVLSTMALIFRPYWANKWDWPELLAYATVFAVLVNVTLMAVEILLGNVIMGLGYDRYCHRHVEEPIRFVGSDGRELLKSVLNFVRLAAFSLMAVAALLHSLHAADSHQGFHGIESSDTATRLETYGEFVAFTLTTFATAGYGDVYPKKLHNRLVVGYLHVLGMVLVLLQVVLGKQRGWPENPSATLASGEGAVHDTNGKTDEANE